METERETWDRYRSPDRGTKVLRARGVDGDQPLKAHIAEGTGTLGSDRRRNPREVDIPKRSDGRRMTREEPRICQVSMESQVGLEEREGPRNQRPKGIGGANRHENTRSNGMTTPDAEHSKRVRTRTGIQRWGDDITATRARDSEKSPIRKTEPSNERSESRGRKPRRTQEQDLANDAEDSQGGEQREDEEVNGAKGGSRGDINTRKNRGARRRERTDGVMKNTTDTFNKKLLIETRRIRGTTKEILHMTDMWSRLTISVVIDRSTPDDLVGVIQERWDTKDDHEQRQWQNHNGRGSDDNDVHGSRVRGTNDVDEKTSTS